jgi:hypothetical protein
MVRSFESAVRFGGNRILMASWHGYRVRLPEFAHPEGIAMVVAMLAGSPGKMTTVLPEGGRTEWCTKANLTHGVILTLRSIVVRPNGVRASATGAVHNSSLHSE